MYENIITTQDVLASFEGTLEETGMSLEWLQARLEEAVLLLRKQCPNAKSIMDNAYPDPEDLALIRIIISRAIHRLLRDDAPGYQSETESGYTYVKNPQEVSSNLWYPDKDLALLGCKPGAKAIGTARLGTSSVYAAPKRHMCSRAIRWW